MVYIKGRFNPSDFLGQTVRIFLITGAIIDLHLQSLAANHLTGVDNENVDITIDVNDIDFIVDLGC